MRRMNAPDTATLTLAEFAELADVTPRTVRYYVQQSLLPSPGSGPKARYGRQHLTRIRLIKQLQKHDVPLSKIRSVLESLDDAGVEQLLDARTAAPDQFGLAAGPAGRSASSLAAPAVDYIRGVLEGRSGLPAPPASFASLPLSRQAQRHVAHGLAESGPAPPPAPTTPATTPPNKARSQWERLPLSPDVELHIRRPLSRHQIKQVDRLIHLATKLFEEDTP